MAFELLQETFKNPFVTVLLSAISPIGVAWLVKKWVTARLTGAINHEYNTRLEEHKKDMQADLKKQQLDIDGELKLQQRNLDVDLKRQQNELDAKLQSVRHQHEISQTRTSLFFEHQVKAFAKLLEQLAWTIEVWNRGWERD